MPSPLSRFAGEGETPQAARVRVCGGSGGQVTHPHPGAARLSLSRKRERVGMRRHPAASTAPEDGVSTSLDMSGSR